MYQGNYQKRFLGITLCKYIDFDYQVNISLLISSLDDYLNCVDSLQRFKYGFNHNRQYQPYFGLAYYDLLNEHLLKEEQNVDLRAYHVLYDHKQAMCMRLECLYEKKLFYTRNIRTLKNNVLHYSKEPFF